jgi:hypothetical protein
MKNLVNIFETVFNSNDEFARMALNYDRALNSEDWKFLVNAIHLIKGQMSVDMFSRKYTEMEASDKDVLQKSYYQTMLILEFLMSPKLWIHKRTEYKQRIADLSKRNKSSNTGGKTW